jgi:hypothetical protein
LRLKLEFKLELECSYSREFRSLQRARDHRRHR